MSSIKSSSSSSILSIQDHYLRVTSTMKINNITFFKVETSLYELSSTTILRKESSFIQLHSKLNDRWPGIYIPSLGINEYTISIFNKENDENKCKRLNEFMGKIRKQKFLMKSKEFEIFLNSDKDQVNQILKELPLHSVIDLMMIYKDSFYKEVNSSLHIKKEKRGSNQSLLISTLVMSNDEKNIKIKSIDQYESLFSSIIQVLHKLKDECYELYTLKTTLNSKSIQFLSTLSKYEKKIIDNSLDICKCVFSHKSIDVKKENLEDNPYLLFFDYFNSIEFDIESFIRSIQSFRGMRENKKIVQMEYNKYIKEVDSLSKGKITSSSIFTFKKKEEVLNEAINKLTMSEMVIKSYDIIYDIIIKYFFVFLNDFKKEIKNEYIRQIQIYNNIQSASSKQILYMIEKINSIINIEDDCDSNKSVIDTESSNSNLIIDYEKSNDNGFNSYVDDLNQINSKSNNEDILEIQEKIYEQKIDNINNN